MLASDGRICSFRDARFHASIGGSHLERSISGMARTIDGRGYWSVESDGLTVHALGNASRS